MFQGDGAQTTCHAARQGAELLNTLQSVSHIAVLIEIGSCNFYLAIWSDHNGMHHLHYLVGPKTSEIQNTPTQPPPPPGKVVIKLPATVEIV